MLVPQRKPVAWVGSAHKDILAMPETVRRTFGFALYEAQTGGKHPDAKPLAGFGGAGVLEVVARHDTDAFRAIYTARFEEAIYVLHVFQKKSTQGIKTPLREMDVVRTRLKQAEEIHRAFQSQTQKEESHER